MFGEVVNEHVTTTAAETSLADLLGGELIGQSFVESSERVETLEHFPVARGVRALALDDVTPVVAVLTDRLQELSALGQCFAQRRP